MIVAGPRQALGFVEITEDPLELPERKECISQIEAKIDRLLHPLAGLRLPLEKMQCLLEGRDSLAVGRTRACKLTRL